MRVNHVADWQERLLDALAEGIPDAMLIPLAMTLGAEPDEAQRFAAQIGGVLHAVDPEPLAIRVEVPEGLPVAAYDALCDGLGAAGVHVVSLTRWADDRLSPAVPVIVAADRMLDPRRAARLMAADVTHLPIELSGDRVQVGPLVVPGRTACSACLHAHRTDADPAWPLLAAQLLGREPTGTDPALVLEAAVLAVRMLRGLTPLPAPRPVADVESNTPRVAGASVTISSADLRRVWRAHRPHASCLCGSVGAGSARADGDRSPAGTATAAEFGRPTAPTSSARACARPA